MGMKIEVGMEVGLTSVCQQGRRWLLVESEKGDRKRPQSAFRHLTEALTGERTGGSTTAPRRQRPFPERRARSRGTDCSGTPRVVDSAGWDGGAQGAAGMAGVGRERNPWSISAGATNGAGRNGVSGTMAGERAAAPGTARLFCAARRCRSSHRSAGQTEPRSPR